MARPTDWHPLAATDPVPGDPWEVSSAAREVRAAAELLRTQAQALRTLAASDGEGRTPDALRTSTTDLAGRLAAAVGRYEGTAAALDAYWPELEHAQDESLAALREAQEAQSRLDAAEAGAAATAAAGTAPVDGTDAVAVAGYERAEADRRADHAAAQGRADAARADLDAARARLRRAEQTRDDAAARAASLVRDACSDPLDDSPWDSFMEWVHDNADVIEAVADLAGVIASVAGVLALAVGWIPVVGQFAAAVLGVVATAAGIVALVGHTLLALSGDGDRGAVALDAVGLLTAGLGRAAGAALKGAGSALKANGAATRAATSAVSSSLGRSASAATARRLATGPLSRATRTEVAAAAGVSGKAVRRAAQSARTSFAENGGAAATDALRASTTRLSLREGLVGDLTKLSEQTGKLRDALSTGAANRAAVAAGGEATGPTNLAGAVAAKWQEGGGLAGALGHHLTGVPGEVKLADLAAAAADPATLGAAADLAGLAAGRSAIGLASAADRVAYAGGTLLGVSGTEVVGGWTPKGVTKQLVGAP